MLFFLINTLSSVMGARCCVCRRKKEEVKAEELDMVVVAVAENKEDETRKMEVQLIRVHADLDRALKRIAELESAAIGTQLDSHTADIPTVGELIHTYRELMLQDLPQLREMAETEWKVKAAEEEDGDTKWSEAEFYEAINGLLLVIWERVTGDIKKCRLDLAAAFPDGQLPPKLWDAALLHMRFHCSRLAGISMKKIDLSHFSDPVPTDFAVSFFYLSWQMVLHHMVLDWHDGIDDEDEAMRWVANSWLDRDVCLAYPAVLLGTKLLEPALIMFNQENGKEKDAYEERRRNEASSS